MAYVSVIGSCFGCGKTFSFNPRLVPSYEGKPVCQACVNVANPRRVANGLEPIKVLPGAYEACEESEVF